MSANEDFSEYVAGRWGRLVRTAILLGCKPPEAEDIVQTALVRCLLHWRRVQQADDQDAYVHRVLLNTFASARRRRWTTERPVAAVPDHSEPDETAKVDQADAVLRSLSRLNDDQRTAVVLRYYTHLTEQQMAVALNVAPGTIKSRLARALKALSDDPHLAELRENR